MAETDTIDQALQERKDLAMLVARLAIRLPDSDPVRGQAIDYLTRKGLAGNLLRIIPECEPPLENHAGR